MNVPTSTPVKHLVTPRLPNLAPCYFVPHYHWPPLREEIMRNTSAASLTGLTYWDYCSYCQACGARAVHDFQMANEHAHGILLQQVVTHPTSPSLSCRSGHKNQAIGKPPGKSLHEHEGAVFLNAASASGCLHASVLDSFAGQGLPAGKSQRTCAASANMLLL